MIKKSFITLVTIWAVTLAGCEDLAEISSGTQAASFDWNDLVHTIEALAFGPKGVLFVGDTKGSSVFAIDFRDDKAAAKTASPRALLRMSGQGKPYILVGNNVHPLMKFNPEEIANADGIEYPSRDRGVKRTNFKEGRIEHMADNNDEYIVVINHDKTKDTLTLRSIPKSDL